MLLRFLSFRSPYHVGWRVAEQFVDHSTVLRALVSVAGLVGDRRFIEAVGSGRVAASALLPTAKVGDGRVRLLAPLPYMPYMVKPSKVGLRWATLTAIRAIAVYASECSGSGGYPYLVSADAGVAVIRCSGGGDALRLPFSDGIVYGGEGEATATPPVMEQVIVYHNRIDRVTGAADLYPLVGYRASMPFWIVFSAEPGILKHIDSLIEILETIGLGGYRSRGWGRFSLVELESYDRDLDVLENHTGWKKGYYHVVLGCILAGYDPERSFGRQRVFMGRSGPSYDEHLLPVIRALDIGSLVYASDKTSTSTHRVEAALGSILVFSPLAVGGW